MEPVHPADPSTLYVQRRVINADDIVTWAKAQGFPATLPPEDMHVTIAFSRTPLEWPAADTKPLAVPAGNNRVVAQFYGGAVVLRIVSPELARRWSEICNLGASWDWPDYHPHITISYDGSSVNLARVRPYQGEIQLGPETMAEVKEEWKDDVVEKSGGVIKIRHHLNTDKRTGDFILHSGEVIFTPEQIAALDVKKSWKDDVMEKIGARHSKGDLADMQAMHDLSVKQGAKCKHIDIHDDNTNGDPPMDKALVRIAKIDENLGMVFGYAIVCKVNGEPYYDLNIDLTGKHVGKRVPEHIPEETMLKACIDFMQTARVGNEMHGGEDKGTFVCAFPLTTDIAKAMGINTNVTGLMVGYKPPPELLSKFKDGTYKGFSIEGRRLSYQEHED